MQESDELFRVHALSVDTLTKVRVVMNRVIIGSKRYGRHLTNDASFDIQILANQLYCLRSIILDGPKPGKVYNSENPYSDIKGSAW